jgi:uncharacterized repeat protein (TIGR03803 family)
MTKAAQVWCSKLREERRSEGIFISGALALLLAILTSPLAQAQKFTLVYSFKGGAAYGNADGSAPNSLIEDSEGNFYGTTNYGGNSASVCQGYGCGIVFKIDTNNKESVLYRFNGDDGWKPNGVLIQDAEGNFYGTALFGGEVSCASGWGCGTVFKLDTDNKLTVLHIFTNSDGDGAEPVGGLVTDANGNYYATTSMGGTEGEGTIFSENAAGSESILHTFTGQTLGRFPEAGMIQDKSGNSYGTTMYGGASDLGTIFKMDSSNKITVLYSFNGNGDGQMPHAGLIRDSAGNLYGTTPWAGNSACYCGTVFKLSTKNKLTVLYKFTGGTDGASPFAGLVRNSAGNLYGAASAGGSFSGSCAGTGGCGTIFEIDSAGKFSVTHTFKGTSDGADPTFLMLDSAGSLHGTAADGGANGAGTVFEIVP